VELGERANVRLERLEVSGGFLDGLRLDIGGGLSVLIGPRGAGKTSVLELIRFALGVSAMTDEADTAAKRQAHAVLGDGTVSVVASVQGEELIFSRTGLDESATVSSPFAYTPPLIVSQSEIEAIGLDPTSRREILDRLTDTLSLSEADPGADRTRIAAVGRRLERVREQQDSMAEQRERFGDLEPDLGRAEAEQAVAAQKADEAKPLHEAIAGDSDELGRIRASVEAYAIAHDTLESWGRSLADARLERPIPSLPSDEVAKQTTAGVARAAELVDQARSEIAGLTSMLASAQVEARSRQGEIQARLKANTDQLEVLEAGAGDTGRRVSVLRQQLREREGLDERIAELTRETEALLAERDDALDALSASTEARYQLRRQRAAALTAEFHGKIEVRVEKSGEFGAYEAALVGALQGSNLQYKALAADVASRMSPRELVEAVEAGDADRVAAAAQITPDRANRLVAHLSQRALTDLLTAPLEDSVDFALLDGQEYKPTRDLSMGQRCTVVLPLLLAEERDAILLDQPEDHLDNAFIVETLVAAIRDRSQTGQVIVATHNANIPVLGEAEQVIVMASDGRHGFVSTSAPLDDDAAVTAITTLMEGGREAFARRAAFYRAHEHGG
jgi:ABC-type branched-subunit amino acid transport system ATPase component